MKDQITSVRDLLLDLLGSWQPRSAGGLTLVPLFGSSRALQYILASEAIDRGLLTISEIDGNGSVPQLAAENRADLPVLLIDGEHLEGAKQNRIMNSSALIAARHRTVLPVSCVEQGRWHYEEEADFTPSDDFAYTRLRALNKADVVHAVRARSSRDVDQSAVWDDLEMKREEVGAFASPTGALGDAYESRRGEVRQILEAFSSPEEGQTGVIASVGGKVIALDSFDKPEVLDRLWTRLVSGYAMDAIGESEEETSEEPVKAFLADAAGAEASIHEGIGLGFDVVLSGNAIVGNALTYEDGVVHLAVFPISSKRSNAREGSLIERPTRRSGRRSPPDVVE